MRTFTVALLLLVASSAGCFGGEDGDAGQTPDPTGTGTPSPQPSPSPSPTPGPSPTSSPPPGQNQPPQPSLSVDVDAGEAPLTVVFTLDGSDPDGDPVTWTFDANGDGEYEAQGTGNDLPMEISFTYEDPGQYTAVLAMSDGEESVGANRVIAVSAPGEVDWEDRGWYFYDPTTSLCHVKEYDSIPPAPAPPVFYVSTMSGGTWILAETNGVAGLQAEDNHPAGPPFALDIPDCVDGDLVVV